MKAKKTLLLIFFGICLNCIYANTEDFLERDTSYFKNSINNANDAYTLTGIEGWFEGQVLSGNLLMTYFNISQGEFLEYVSINAVEKITIDYFWQSIDGTEIQEIKTDILENFDGGFNVESWTSQIENIDTSAREYLAQVTINDELCGPKITVSLINEVIEEEEEELPIELPEYICGEEFTLENITDQTPLQSANPGDVFFIGGFPILLQSVSGSNGVFSGEGIVPLPFGSKVVKVDFVNIYVNETLQVFQGTVNAMPGDPASYPDFDPDYEPINIGGDICLPPPPPPGYDSTGVNEVTGLNDWGFDPLTGLHTNGTNYDDNGFDINGNHISTGTNFNEQGCNREGIDIDGQPCDPSGGSFPAAGEFADSIASSLAPQVNTIITALTSEIQDSLNTLDCNAIRSEMESLLNILGYDRLFILGENDKYFAEGMHLEFDEAPQPLALNIERDANAKALEEEHVSLFQCDKKQYALNIFLSVLGQMNGSSSVLDEILQRITNWTEYQYGLYADDPEQFEIWLIATIGDIMLENSGLDDSYTQVDDSIINPVNDFRSPRSIFDFDPSNPLYNAIASNEENALFSTQFTLEDASFYFRQGDQIINGVDRAFYLEELSRQQMFMFDGELENLLPINLEKTVGNRTYSIYLDNISFSVNGATLDAHAIIDDPESGNRLVFKALNISFGPTGVQEEARLHLATDVEIRLNNAALLVLKGTEDTYVAWDCEGFSSIGIDAEIEFCRNFIIPLDPLTLQPKPEPERYRLSVAVQDITKWLDFYLVVNAEPFAVAQYEDVKWELTNLVIDLSSESTPEFIPMEGYASPFWDGVIMSPGWKGFYMQDLSATLPNDFSNNTDPITANAFDILIDDCGFTGGVSVENLITFEEGSIGGWPFSIDAFEVRILKNQFAGAGLAGQMNVPIFEENMDYEAVMYPGNVYSFAVSPSETATVNMFLATADIYEDSYIAIEKDEDGFLAVATLNGKMHVNTGNDPDASVDLNLPSLCFEQFEVSNRAPYFSPGVWGLTGTGSTGVAIDFNGFGVRVDSIMPYSPGEGEAGIGFNLDINLAGGDLGIGAGGQVGILGELVHVNGRQRWQYKKVEVGSIFIESSFPGANIVGFLDWYDEGNTSQWGKGFRGVVSAQFEGLDIGLQAAAQFGSVNDYKYFFVDALADLGTGIGSGAIQLKGFGGGISNNMDINQNQVILVNQSGNFTLPPMGTSFSGTVYTPNQSAGLSLKATAILATLNDEIFNGTVSLLFQFNDNNGIDEISLLGSGQFLSSIDLGILPDFVPGATSPPASVNASLTAFIDLSYNFNEPSFHGELSAFLNAGFIQGSGAGGKLVNAELHFDPTKWYIYIGRPEEGQRCGISVTLPLIDTDLQTTAYFDVGTEVPPMPNLPDNVAQVAYLINNNQSLRQSGAGLVFGAAIDFEISAKIAGIISTTLGAQAGFDMMLRKYDGLTCQGSNEPVGINGWYASGQMWAYVYGSLEVFGVNIMSAGLAAVLQARLPNPFWAQATVGVEIEILFATVNHSLKLELGDDCVLVSDNPQNELGLEVVTFLEPFDGATDIETNFRPKANFALELNRTYTIADLAGDEQAYKAELNYARLTNGNGYELDFTENFLNDFSSLEVIPKNSLPANDSISFEVSVRISKNGSFLADEVKSIYFFTGDALDYIPETNVAASYPLDGMANFYKDENNLQQGYIQLVSGQPELFENVPAGKAIKVRLIGTNNSISYLNYEYDQDNQRLVFPLSSAFLINNQFYKLELVEVPTWQSNEESEDSGSDPDNIIEIALGRGDGNGVGASVNNSGPSPDQEVNTSIGIETTRILYSIYFRVSEYNTLGDKLDAVMGQDVQDGFSDLMYVDLQALEIFDVLELEGNNKYQPLIKLRADLDNTTWIEEEVKPLFETIEHELCDAVPPEVENIGQPARVTGNYGNTIVTESSFLNNTIDFGNENKFRYELGPMVYDAFLGGQQELGFCLSAAYNEYFQTCENVTNPPAECEALEDLENLLINLDAPVMPNGTYKVRVEYKFPNGPTLTSRTINFIKD